MEERRDIITTRKEGREGGEGPGRRREIAGLLTEIEIGSRNEI
jgi:hypothetical protein